MKFVAGVVEWADTVDSKSTALGACGIVPRLRYQEFGARSLKKAVWLITGNIQERYLSGPPF